MSVRPDVRLDFAAVERYIARWHPDPCGDRQLGATIHDSVVAAPWAATLLDLKRSTVLRYRAKGCRYFEADDVATRLGVHPSRIWPDWYDVDPDMPDEPVWRQLRREALAESHRLREMIR